MFVLNRALTLPYFSTFLTLCTWYATLQRYGLGPNFERSFIEVNLTQLM
jgi:hypothetical protein